MSSRNRRGNSGGVEVYLPITPMLDMTFQLLFYFVSTFNPVPVEGQIAMKLPAEDTGGAVLNPDPFQDKKDKYRVIIYAEGGDYKLFDLKGDAFSKESIPPDLNKLREELNVIVNKEKVSLTLEIQDNLTYAKLISIMDYLRQAGFVDIGVSGMSKEKT